MATIIPIRKEIGQRAIELVIGDITEQVVDAIVNAANSRLAGGGGVDGAIHRAGGPTIMAETDAKYPEGCPSGSAVVTSAGELKARYIIHAVGPVWGGGTRGEEALLASAYRTSLNLADGHGCRSIALPAISTGAYRYLLDAAARTALATTQECLRKLANDRPLALVRFVLYSSDVMSAFEKAIQTL